MATVPDKRPDPFERNAVAELTTVGADSAPEVTHVWIDGASTSVRFDAAKGCMKHQNLASTPKVALAVQDPETPYRCGQVRRRTEESCPADVDAHIDSLAEKYLGPDTHPDEVRVIYKILLERVQGTSGR